MLKLSVETHLQSQRKEIGQQTQTSSLATGSGRKLF